MLKLYSSGKEFAGYLTEYKNLCIESDLSSGDKSLSFEYLGNPADIANEEYIETKTDRYVVKEITPGVNGTQVRCQLDLEALEAGMFQQFTAKDKTCAQAAALALVNTGWRVSVAEDLAAKIRSVQTFRATPLTCLGKIRDAFMCELRFDSLQQIVYFASEFGEDRGVYFLDGLNLKSLDETIDSYDYYTRIIPIGDDGLTIEDVNDGKNYVENHQYSDKVRTLIWEDSSYTDAQALMDDAIQKLDDMSKPKKSYRLRVVDLAKQSLDYSVLSYDLGDTVQIVSGPLGIKEKQRIVSMKEYPDSPSDNECEVANTWLTWEEMQDRLDKAADAWETVSNSDGSIKGVYVHGVKAGDVVDIEVVVNDEISTNSTITGMQSDITTLGGQIQAVGLRVGSIESTYITATDVAATYATITNLDATNATVHDLNADYGTFKAATVTELGAHQAVINSLDATYATVDLLNVRAGSITTAMLGTGVVDTAQIADGSITDAKIVELTANKINAGTLSVDRLEIRGSNTSIVYAINNITGAIQAQNVDTINGEVLTPRTITADKIVANAITAAEIASQTITANEIAAGTSTANEIASQTITANEIAANTITANQIASHTITADEITANNIAGTNGWINLASGTFNYGNGALSWDGSALSVTGTVNASNGKIGGWSIGQNDLHSTNSSGNYVTLANGSNSTQDVLVVRTGSSGSYSYPFYLRADGTLHTGMLDATGGTIGGWTIGTNSLYTQDSSGNKISLTNHNGGGTTFANVGMTMQASSNRLTAAYKLEEWSIADNTNTSYNYVSYAGAQAITARKDNKSGTTVSTVRLDSANNKISAVTTAAALTELLLQNSLRNISLHVNASGVAVLWDNTNRSAIIQSATNGNVSIPHLLSVSSMTSVGSVTVGSTDSGGTGAVYAVSAARRIALHANAAGNCGLYDTGHDVWILRSDSNQGVYIPHNTYVSGDYLYLGTTAATNSPNIICANNKNNVALSTTQSSAGVYHHNGSGASAKWLISIDTSGTVTANTSDERYKNIFGITPEDEALALLRGVDVINFEYKEDANHLTQNGFRAQQIRDVLQDNEIGLRPYLIIEDNQNSHTPIYDLSTPETDDITYSVDYSRFTPILWKGWQIHDAEIEALKDEIAQLKAQLAS